MKDERNSFYDEKTGVRWVQFSKDIFPGCSFYKCLECENTFGCLAIHHPCNFNGHSPMGRQYKENKSEVADMPITREDFVEKGVAPTGRTKGDSVRGKIIEKLASTEDCFSINDMVTELGLPEDKAKTVKRAMNALVRKQKLDKQEVDSVVYYGKKL